MSYLQQQSAMEQRNWDGDSRVRAASSSDFFAAINDTKMELLLRLEEIEDDDGNLVDWEHWFPFKREVCGTCDGKGTHTDPQIDCDGLGYEDFAEDRDFEEDYFSGRYDVTCYGCGGKNVEPVLDYDHFSDEQKEQIKVWEEWKRDEAEYESICRAERAMGA
jgi:hypothetical protein